MTLVNVDPVQNTGTGAPNSDLVHDGATPDLYAVARPEYQGGLKLLTGTLPGTADYLPLTRDDLYTNALCVWAEADKTAGTDWVNSGTLGTDGDLTYRNTIVQNDHFKLPGTSGNYLSVPDEAALDLTTEIEVVMRVASQKWHNRSGNQRLISKRSGGGQSYEVLIGYDSQMGKIGFTPNGSQFVYSRAAVPVSNGDTCWIKITYTTTDIFFYWAPDQTSEPSTWYSLGSAQTLGVTMTANTHTLYLGGIGSIGADMLEGRIYNTIIRSTVGGSTVLNVDVPTDTTALTPGVSTSFTATSGQTVTIANSGGVNGTYLTRTTVNALIPYYEMAVDPDLLLSEDESMLIWAVVDSPDPPNTMHMIHTLGFWGGATSAFAVAKIDASNNKVFTTYFGGTSSDTAQRGSDLSATGYNAPTTQRYVIMMRLVRETATSLDVRPAAYGETTETIINIPPYDQYNGDVSNVDWEMFKVLGLDNVSTINVIEAGITLYSGDDTNSDTVASELFTNWGRAALDLTPDYDLGEGWIISDDGDLAGGINEDVLTGDIVYLTDNDPPTWAVIDKAARGSVWATLGPSYWEGNASMPDEIVISGTQDVFMWVVLSHPTGSTVTIDLWDVNSPTGNGNVWLALYPEYSEIDVMVIDNAGDFLYEYWEDIPALDFSGGLDSPIMIAAWLSRATDLVTVYVDGSVVGTVSASAIDTITIHDTGANVEIHQCPNTLVWGRGFTWGVDVIPPTWQIDHLFELLVNDGPLEG